VKHFASSFGRFQQTRNPPNKQLHGKPATGVNTYSVTEPVWWASCHLPQRSVGEPRKNEASR